MQGKISIYFDNAFISVIMELKGGGISEWSLIIVEYPFYIKKWSENYGVVKQ